MLDEIGIGFVGNHIVARLVATRVYLHSGHCHKTTIFGVQSQPFGMGKMKTQNAFRWFVMLIRWMRVSDNHLCESHWIFKKRRRPITIAHNAAFSERDILLKWSSESITIGQEANNLLAICMQSLLHKLHSSAPTKPWLYRCVLVCIFLSRSAFPAGNTNSKQIFAVFLIYFKNIIYLMHWK